MTLIYFSVTSLDLIKYGLSSPYSVDKDYQVFSYLTNFIKLETLRLHKRLCLPVGCYTIRNLTVLSNLTSLDVMEFNPDERELHLMSETWTNLIELRVTRFIPLLQNFVKLKNLNLSRSREINPLVFLCLNSTEKIQELASLTCPTPLPSVHNVIGDRRSWTNLVSLVLRQTHVPDMSCLSALPNLEVLDLGHCNFRCNHRAVADGCTTVSQEWRWILKLPKLEKLCLCFPKPLPKVSKLVLFNQQSNLSQLCGRGWIEENEGAWGRRMQSLFPNLKISGCYFCE